MALRTNRTAQQQQRPSQGHSTTTSAQQLRQQQQRQESPKQQPPKRGRRQESTLNRRKLFIAGELAALDQLRSAILVQIRPLSPLERLQPHHYGRLTIDRIAQRYIRYINCPLPALHECVLGIQLAQVVDHPATCSAQDRFQVLMVMACALASLTRSQHESSELGRLSRALYQATQQLKQDLPKRGWKRLQNVVLTMQYALLVPSSERECQGKLFFSSPSSSSSDSVLFFRFIALSSGV